MPLTLSLSVGDTIVTYAGVAVTADDTLCVEKIKSAHRVFPIVFFHGVTHIHVFCTQPCSIS